MNHFQNLIKSLESLPRGKAMKIIQTINVAALKNSLEFGQDQEIADAWLSLHHDCFEYATQRAREYGII